MLFNPKHYSSLLHLFQFSPYIQSYTVVLFTITCEHVFGVISWTETYELLMNALSSSKTSPLHITFASAHHKRTCRLWRTVKQKQTSKNFFYSFHEKAIGRTLAEAKEGNFRRYLISSNLVGAWCLMQLEALDWYQNQSPKIGYQIIKSLWNELHTNLDRGLYV